MPLAERREKKRYVLMPRGKPLFEDTNRFGTKMLEKMGWSVGKGLGANEDGSNEFVRLRYKNNNTGLGYKDRDDQWTENENRFDGLLKSLNNSDSEQNANERVGFGSKSKSENSKNIFCPKKIESLEEKSKSSKSRVHYRKFTKSKDLSQYSEKDLANIFGKKYLSAVESQENKSSSNSLNDAESSKKNGNHDNPESSNSNVKATLEEEKRIGDNIEEEIVNENKMMEESQIPEISKKKKKKKSKNKDQENPSEIVVRNDKHTEEAQIEKIIEEINCVKKKSKKRKLREMEEQDCSSKIDDNIDSGVIDTEPKKKKKKTKHEEPINNNEAKILENLINSNRNENVENNHLKTKKKNSKRQDTEEKHQESSTVVENEVVLVKNVNTSLDESSVLKSEKHGKKKKKLAKTELDLTKDVDTIDKPENVLIEENNTIKKNSRKPVENDFKEKTSEEITVNTISDTISSRKGKESEKIESIRTQEEKGKDKNQSNETPNDESVYVINAFHAELFRFSDFTSFKNSNIINITGYGLSENIKLQVERRENDEIQIYDLWKKSAIKSNKPTEETDKTDKKKKYNKFVSHLKRVQSFVKV